jgi:hypothetical protein
MAEISAQELIEWFKTTTDRTIPYRNSQMIAAVKDAASLKDMDSLEQLSDAMVGAYIRLNPDKSNETMVRNARETLATLAYLADHEPASPAEWIALGPIKAYKSPQQYGTAMGLVKRIYDNKQIDLMRDVYNGFDPSLN